jgi:hypothetical protein
MRSMQAKVFKAVFVIVIICFPGTIKVDAQKRFSIIAFGDMPYHPPQDIERFKRLTREVNKFNPLFSVHVGDIKNGASDCSDAYFYQIKALFMEFEKPLIYTPGDNEWTDCNRPLAGNYNPEERLQKLRTIFYDGQHSLGKKTLKTFNQNKVRGFEKYVENQYWEHGGVSFGTIHVVGTNNNLIANTSTREYLARDSANLNWLDYIFDEAERKHQIGIVLFTQAAMNFKSTTPTGYSNIIKKLQERVTRFQKPVLLVYGDAHRFLVEKPLTDTNGKLVVNFTSLMVFGEADMHAVRIDINTKQPNLFTFSEFIVDGN